MRRTRFCTVLRCNHSLFPVAALGQLPVAEHSGPGTVSKAPSSPSSHTPPQPLTWSQRSSELHAKLTDQIAALQHSIHLKERHLSESLPLVRKLMAASQESPAHTAHALASWGQRVPRLHSHTQWPVVACAQAGGGGCTRKALPFSRYCLKREWLSVCPSLAWHSQCMLAPVCAAAQQCTYLHGVVW